MISEEEIETSLDNEDEPVVLRRQLPCAEYPQGFLIIEATNEGGYNGTSVDLVELIAWIRAHRPELLADLGLQDVAVSR